MDLTDTYRAFHPTAAEHTFFSNAHGTFSRIDHMTGHQTSLGKFKKTEIIPSFFSNHKSVKREINNMRKAGKITNIWELNNTPKQTMNEKRTQRGNFKVS